MTNVVTVTPPPLAPGQSERMGQYRMTTSPRQDSMRTHGRGRAAQAFYQNPRCQWRGGTKTDCSDIILAVRVRVPFPAPSEHDVRACSEHMPAYKRMARDARMLV